MSMLGRLELQFVQQSVEMLMLCLQRRLVEGYTGYRCLRGVLQVTYLIRIGCPTRLE